MDNAKRNLDSIQCYKHNQKLTYVDLGEIPQTGTRILCNDCPQSKKGIQVQQFQNLCFDFTSKLKQANNPLIENVRNVYLTSLQQIHDLLSNFNKKVQESLFRASCSSNLYDRIDKLFTSLPQRYHFNDFESIAQAMSESVEKKQNLWEFKAFEINDQKLAEAHHFQNITNQLLQTITNFFINEGIKDEIQQENLLLQNTKAEQILSSKKLLTGHDSYISQLQFNYDSSIICARFKESFNFLAFWKQDQYFEWKAMQNLSCFDAGITTFTFSKHGNTLITAGNDQENDAQKTSYLKIWKYENQEWNLINKQRCSSRITSMKLTVDEQNILVAVGCNIEIYSMKNWELKLLSLCKIENEILYDLSYQDNLLATATGDGKFKIYQVNQIFELQLKGFMKVNSTPKQVIYNDNIIYGLCKDGMVYIMKYVQSNLQLIQTINNNLGKYRAMYFETIQKYLALGDESNNVQLWSFENTGQLICFTQIKQEDYVETICISEKQDLLISSSDKDIMFHYNFI